MPSRIQIASAGIAVFRRCRFVTAFLLPAILLACPALLRGQQAPSGTVAWVEGVDVSVEGGSSAGNGASAAAPRIFVVNGSVVTVHSGNAQMMLLAGGKVDICGPAKLTLLQSGGAITLALNFGRVRVQLPAATALRIFTPTIVATPLGIGGGARDITIGLELNDSLCVLAASGALRLESQFTGEGLIVPQAGEFFLANGKLSPVAGTPGTCRCDLQQARVAPTPPPLALPLADVPIIVKAQPATQQPPQAAPATPVQESEPSVEYSVLSKSNDTHPMKTTPKETAPPPPPPSSTPEYKVVAPPLMFSASSPNLPPDPTPDMIVLIRYARVEHEWKFKGHVEAPRLEMVARHSSARNPAPAKKQQQKKEGFWARLRHAFGGSSSGPKPCEGIGCG